MKDNKENWILIGRYVAVIIAALLLAAILGNMELFKKTAVAGTKLSASQIVRFLGYGGALVVFWLAVQRLTLILQHQGGRWSGLQHVVLPLGTLIVVATAYKVLLIVLTPLLDRSMKGIYDWVFILGTIGTAIWLIVAMFNQSSPLTEMIMGNLIKEKEPERRCKECGTENSPSAKFCVNCGTPL